MVRTVRLMVGVALVMMSLAGLVAAPNRPPAPTRIGGDIPAPVPTKKVSPVNGLSAPQGGSTHLPNRPAQSPSGVAQTERLAKTIDFLHKHRSVVYDTDGTLELLGDGLTIKISVGLAFAYAAPGRARVDIKGPVGLRMLTVADGVTTWTYNGALNQYSKKTEAMDLSAILAELQYTNLAGLTAELAGALKIKTTPLRDETVTIGGVPRLCSVVESRLDALDLPAPVPVDFAMKNMIATEWTDKQLGVPVKSTASFQVSVGAGLIEIRAVNAMKTLKVDEAVTAGTFTFTPPPNAREIRGPGGADK